MYFKSYIFIIGFMLITLPVFAQSGYQGNSINFPDRTIEDWNPEKAVMEAENDIKSNELKIYYSGTIAATPVGVSQEDYELIKDLPIADGGIGCVISDQELRQAQYAYSMRYNRIVVKHLKRQGEIKKQSK
jgi:hypothetical protein